MLCSVSSLKKDSKLDNKSPFEELFGEHLNKWNRKGDLDTERTDILLKNKDVVGIYFSAGWCGPCRQFTPLLVDFYNEMNKKGKKFEIVFVSQDRSEEDFVNYYSKMPWLALPIENLHDHLQSLAYKFSLKGIPHFVILDGHDASVFTLDGRSKILNDKYGLEFPYRPRTPLNLIPRPIKNLVNGVVGRSVTIVKGILINLKNGLGRVLLAVIDKIVPKFLLKMFRK